MGLGTSWIGREEGGSLSFRPLAAKGMKMVPKMVVAMLVAHMQFIDWNGATHGARLRDASSGFYGAATTPVIQATGSLAITAHLEHALRSRLSNFVRVSRSIQRAPDRNSDSHTQNDWMQSLNPIGAISTEIGITEQQLNTAVSLELNATVTTAVLVVATRTRLVAIARKGFPARGILASYQDPGLRGTEGSVRLTGRLRNMANKATLKCPHAKLMVGLLDKDLWFPFCTTRVMPSAEEAALQPTNIK